MPLASGYRASCAALAAAAGVMLCGCAAAPPPATLAGRHGGATASPGHPAGHPGPAPSPSPQPLAGPLPVAPGAGRLPQTSASPRAAGPPFRAVITDLWLAVRTGRPSLAEPAFFPVRAYDQAKASYDPAGDWRYRLWVDFSLDVRAAHRLLGRNAARAALVRVIVPSSQAVWVGTGACYNRVGYWHVSGPRVVYRLDGRLHSFGIASMISWRGVWYVIHFGGITRPAVGMVDAPAAGPGYPGPPGGC